MKLYIDNATNTLVTSATLAATPTITLFKEDVIPSVEIRFVENGSVVDIGTPSIRLALGKDGGLIAFTDSWTKNGTGATAYWTGNFNLNTQQAEMVLAGLGSTETILEVEVRQGDLVATKAQIPVTLKTDLINETDTATDIGNIVTIGASHIAGTTNVHGIANTANLVLTNDSRLTDSRAPTAHKSSHATGGTDALSASDIGAVVTTDTRIANIRGSSIDTRAGAVTERTYQTGDPEEPTGYETSHDGGSGGSIIMKGGDGGFDSIGGGVGGNSGSINLSGFTGNGGDSNGGNGGSITLMGGLDSAHAGSINLSGGSGGADNHGGSIISTGNNDYRGGTLNMSANGDGNGGSIDTSGGGGSINTSAGGSINTSSGGGSINTSGISTPPSIGFGSSWDNGGKGVTTFIGRVGQSANYPRSADRNTDKTIYLPNANGTIALESTAKDIAVDYLYNYAGIDAGYVITNIKFRQTLSNSIWQAQTSPITGEFNRDATTAKNNPLAPFTRVLAGGYNMFWNGSGLGVGTLGDSYNEPYLAVSNAKLLATLASSNQQSGRTIFLTYDVWEATDYNDYLPISAYTYCEVTWIKTTEKTNFTTGKLVLGNTDRTTTIQATSTAPRTISIPDATPQGGTFALWPRVSYGGIISASAVDAFSGAGTYAMIQGSGVGGSIQVASNGAITIASAGTGYVDGQAIRAGGSRYNLVTQATLPAPANLPVITTTGGNISAGSFGTTANTFCQGNDVRLGAKTIFTLGGDEKITYALGTSYVYGAHITRPSKVSGGFDQTGLYIQGNWTITALIIMAIYPSTGTASVTYGLVKINSATSVTNLWTAPSTSPLSNGLNTINNNLINNNINLADGDKIGFQLAISGAVGATVPTNANNTTILANIYCVPR